MSADDRGWGHPIPHGDDRIIALSVNGVGFPSGVHQRVRTIMAHLAADYHREVEPLMDPGCWGHAYRTISGSNSWSNHAWGLAVDINAPRYPMGYDRMSASKKRACQAIAARYGCRWGGDYTGTLDQMHFEYMGTPAEADELMRRLESTQEDDMIGLRKGDSGERVKGLQALIQYAGVELERWGVDGDYGDETAEGLRQVRENVGSRALEGYGDRVSGWAYAQLMKAVARRQD